MDRASMLSIKRRLSSMSLRQKTNNNNISTAHLETATDQDLIKAGLPDNQQPQADQILPQSSGTITPLINGIRDIIEDAFPMPSARHVPPELQRRLSRLPSIQAQHPSTGVSTGSRRRSVQQGPQSGPADVLVIEDSSIPPAEDALAGFRSHNPVLRPAQTEADQRVLRSDNSLVWELPQLPSTSSARPRTQGVSRPQSRALTSASSAARPRPNQAQKAGPASTGRAVNGRGQFSTTSSAHGQDAAAQVLHLDQSLHHPASSTTAQNERRAGQTRRRQSLVHLQQRGRERRSSQASRQYDEVAMEDDATGTTRSAAMSQSAPSARPGQPSQQRKPELGSAAVSGKAAAEAGGGGKASKWKQHSAQLRLAMQANKGGSKGEAAAAMLAETHQASLVPCPHCGRSFSEIAAERHIPKCQDIVHKPSRLMAGGGIGAHQRVQSGRH